MKNAFLVLALLSLVSCVSTHKLQSKAPGPEYELNPLGVYDIPYAKLPKDIGPWVNDHAGNPKLAGVIVNQYNEGPEAKAPYIHKHPACIWYIFWNGDVESIEYAPNGTINIRSLWKHNFKTKEMWKQVDFSYGSDPHFKRHPDPRV